MDEILRMRNITKRFPGVLALDKADLVLYSGDVLALVGENGAGKSTLVKIISGAYQQDSGDIIFEGKDVGKLTPKKSIDYGIAVIYQELNYMPYMTVAENIFMGHQPTKHGIVDYKKLRADSMEIQKSLGLGHLDPFEDVQNLSTAEKQLLEIARACERNAKLLILDEPTSALNEAETEILFNQIKKLQSMGKGIIYISHKMDEIFDICNKIEIMRDGVVVKTCEMNQITRDEIVTSMVGREIKDMYPIKPREFGNELMQVENLKCEGVKGANINVHCGEIVGLYGLIGSGCEEVLKSLFGIIKSTNESLTLNGEKIVLTNPIEAIDAGLAYTPGERKTEGLMLNQSVCSNISTVTLKKYRKFGILKLNKEKAVAKRWVDALRIKTPSVDTLSVSLSGGNQQKVILARWLENKPKLFLMNEPTKGIDVGAKVEIYKQMEEICNQGCGILLVTSDLPELLSVCDRVYVFHEGKITNEFNKKEMSANLIIKSAVEA